MAFDAQRTHNEVTLGFDSRSRDLHSALLALKRPPGSRHTRSAAWGFAPPAPPVHVMRPLRYFPRRSEEQKKQAKRAAHRRWVERNREAYLARKRQRAARPEVLEQRRIRYMHRNDPKRAPAKVLTLDAWAKSLTQ